MKKYKLSISLFVIFFITIISITTIKAQNSCPVFIPRPATFVSANKTATLGNMSYVLDGEGTTGIPSDNNGNYSVYWLQSANPVTFNFTMKAVSTVSKVKFYSSWGTGEGVKDVIIRLYDGATLLGTENLTLPINYGTRYVATLSKSYQNVTKIQMVVSNDYNISTSSPKRTSITEVVFGDTNCTDTDGDAVVDYLDLDNDNDGIKDLDENCSGFLAQNTSGDWKGKTLSTLTATLTGANAQTNVHLFQDQQIKFYVNQNGGENRYAKNGNVNLTYTFSNPVPANEIAFFIDDLDPAQFSTPNASFSFKINGGDLNGNFSLPNYSSSPSAYLNFDNITGSITSSSSTLDNQRIIIKGISTLLVSTITIISSGLSNSDGVAYALFANHPCDTDGDNILDYLDLDSDNDGCPDAIEGGSSFTTSDLVNSTMPGGNSGASSGTYNLPIIQNLGNTVGSTITIMGIPTIAGAGQDVGDSQNSSINNQCNVVCYKSAQTSGTTLDTKHGITALSRAGNDISNWPMIRKGAWTALEAKTKGFVVNRLTDDEINAIPSSELVEGMMLYNTTQNCLQINIDGTNTGWKCFNTPTCPD